MTARTNAPAPPHIDATLNAALRAPWAHALRDAALRLAPLDEPLGPDEIAARLGPLAPRNARGAPLRFADTTGATPMRGRRKRPAKPIDPTDLYEGQVYARGTVPTRAANWHDLFNALAWASFPKTKAALNAAHWGELTAHIGPQTCALPNARTPVQDALAMLDEGGVLLAVAPARLAALGAALAPQGLHEHEVARTLERYGAEPFVLGHALAEHWRVRDVPLRALLYPVGVPPVLLERYALAPGPDTHRALRLAVDDAVPPTLAGFTRAGAHSGLVRPLLFAPRMRALAF